jgi:hypothetical protein
LAVAVCFGLIFGRFAAGALELALELGLVAGLLALGFDGALGFGAAFVFPCVAPEDPPLGFGF